MFMYKESPTSPPGRRARYTALVLVPLIAAFSTDGQTLLAPPPACALSGQLAQAETFDPGEVDFVSKPKPITPVNLKLDATTGFVARIASLRPFIVEILDTTGDQFADFHSCQMARILSVDAHLRHALSRLRFNDVVKGEFLYAEGGVAKLVVSKLQKVEGAPVYFHDRDKATCDNRTGTLMIYQSPSRGRLVVYNDLTISYRDQKGKFFTGQKLGSGSVDRLMQSLAEVNFNAFPSRKWTDELAVDSAITLVCSRYQKVMFDGHEDAFAPVLRSIDRVGEIARANTSYLLSYKEKRKIAFLEWPLPDLAPEQAEDLRRRFALVDEPQSDSRFQPFRQRLPQEFLDKIPVFGSHWRNTDLDAYVKSNSRIFRLGRDGDVAPALAGTLYEVRVGEVVQPDNAFAKMANPAVEPPCASLAILGNMFWPSDTGVELQRIPSTGQPVSLEEYAAHQPLYGRIFRSCSRAGFDFIEGDYLYKNVQLTRVQRDSQ